jgi:tetratricopeptide (TPR) repeat protein
MVSCALFTACNRQAPGPPPRYAFVGFENLSGDPSLDWASRGASEFLPASLNTALAGDHAQVLSPDAIARAGQSLGTHPAGAPGISASRASAIAAGANHIISGYLEKTPAGVRVTASEENSDSHQTVRALPSVAATPFEALTRLAHQFSAGAAPPGTTNADAFRLFCIALGGTTSDAPRLLEQAVALDPSFGRAWLLLTRTYIALGDRPRASDAITRARAQKIPPVDSAWLDFENASLNGDRTTSLTAMRKVFDIDTGDTGLGRTLAENETAAGDFTGAAAVWKKITAGNSSDGGAWNELAYSQAWSGDYSGALAAVREYARLRPNDPNPLDSEGDIHYWFGKYAEAAASFSAAHAKSPAFLNGGDLYKTAWAKFRAGDQSGAQASFDKFRDLREKAKDPATDLLAGDWLYRTGQAGAAVDLLRKGSAGPVAERLPAIRTAIANQLAVWDLLAGDRALAGKDAAVSGSSGLTPADLIVRFIAMPTASAQEWQTRAGQLFAPPQLAGFRLTALGYALVLDGKKQAAIPVWEEIVKQTPGNDFFAQLMLRRLKGQPLEHLPAPDPANINQFAALPEKI